MNGRPTTCLSGHLLTWQSPVNATCDGDECPPIWREEGGELWPLINGGIGIAWYRATIRAERQAREAAPSPGEPSDADTLRTRVAALESAIQHMAHVPGRAGGYCVECCTMFPDHSAGCTVGKVLRGEPVDWSVNLPYQVGQMVDVHCSDGVTRPGIIIETPSVPSGAWTIRLAGGLTSMALESDLEPLR